MQAPYASITATKISPSRQEPPQDPLVFKKGDQVTLKYLFKNLVCTEDRPVDAFGLPMYSADEVTAGQPATDGNTVEDTTEDGNTVDADWSGTRLPADWIRLDWHAEIRSGYMSTFRMYNGWVPWYGRRPRYSWWGKAGFRGSFECSTEWNLDELGTVVTCILPSLSSSKILPAQSVYNWDLESGRPVWEDTEDPNVDPPSSYTALRTWVTGPVTVLQDWTQRTVIS